MNDTTLTPPPERRLIATRREYLEAAEVIIAGAVRELRIFDPDLVQLELNGPVRSGLIREFLARHRDNRLFIALHEPDHLARACPRMMSVLRLFAGSVQVHRTEGDAARAQDCFVIADASDFVRRPVSAQSRGVVSLRDDKEAHSIRDRFEEIWQSSVEAVSPTTLGL